jgi:hypothetical protein
MKVTYIQQVTFLAVDPALLGQRLAFWAMAVAAGIVGDSCISAFTTDIGMTAQGRGPALFNGGHDFVLFKR